MVSETWFFFVFFVLSFILSWFLSDIFILKLMGFFKSINLVIPDAQKKKKPLLTIGYGFPIATSLLLSISVVLIVNRISKFFIIDEKLLLIAGFAAFLTMLVGFLDDLNTRVKKIERGKRIDKIGLPQSKFILVAIAGIVFISSLSFNTTIDFVFFSFDFGILYYLFVVLAIIGTANAANMLAGINGLEVFSIIIITAFLGLVSLVFGRVEGFLFALLGVGVLIPFYIRNRFPAKILPGDSLTYFSGVVFGLTAILSKLELFAAFLFVPWFLEFLLKLRSRLKARSYGNLQKDGTLKSPYGKKIYSLTHIAMLFPEFFWKKRFTEKQVFNFLVGLIFLWSLIVFILFLVLM